MPRNPVRPWKYGAIAGTAVLLWSLGLNAPSPADCHADYTQALTLLDHTTQQASANQHPNPDTFSNDFKAIINQLQAEKCMPELMNLIRHIQTEQKKLPAPSDPEAKPAPVTD